VAHTGVKTSGLDRFRGAAGAYGEVIRSRPYFLEPLIPNVLARDYRNPRWLFMLYILRGLGDVLLAIVTPLPIAMVLLFI
jgi:hypothetical protein